MLNKGSEGGLLPDQQLQVTLRKVPVLLEVKILRHSTGMDPARKSFITRLSQGQEHVNRFLDNFAI